MAIEDDWYLGVQPTKDKRTVSVCKDSGKDSWADTGATTLFPVDDLWDSSLNLEVSVNEVGGDLGWLCNSNNIAPSPQSPSPAQSLLSPQSLFFPQSPPSPPLCLTRAVAPPTYVEPQASTPPATPEELPPTATTPDLNLPNSHGSDDGGNTLGNCTDSEENTRTGNGGDDAVMKIVDDADDDDDSSVTMSPASSPTCSFGEPVDEEEKELQFDEDHTMTEAEKSPESTAGSDLQECINDHVVAADDQTGSSAVHNYLSKTRDAVDECDPSGCCSMDIKNRLSIIPLLDDLEDEDSLGDSPSPPGVESSYFQNVEVETRTGISFERTLNSSYSSNIFPCEANSYTANFANSATGLPNVVDNNQPSCSNYTYQCSSGGGSSSSNYSFSNSGLSTSSKTQPSSGTATNGSPFYKGEALKLMEDGMKKIDDYERRLCRFVLHK